MSLRLIRLLRGGQSELPRRPIELVLTVSMLLVAPAARGQEAVEGPPSFQFSFSNPGARSMGFAGAFVALADDATAAFANPAGLVQLLQPEVSLEARRWSYSTPFTERGRIEGAPSGFGIDTISGLRSGRSADDITGLSFLAVVYPKKNWSLAFYGHQLANFESLTETQGLFSGGTNCCQNRFFDQRSSTDLDIVSYGVAGAYRVSEALSLGGRFVYFDGALDIIGENFNFDDDSVDSIFAPNSYLMERLAERAFLRIDDTDFGFSLGVLWSFLPRWKLGGFYREGPSFEMTGESIAGPANSSDVPAGTSLGRGTSPIAFPDVYGLGLSYRPANERLTIAFEWDRVEYSTIVESLDREDFGNTDLFVLDDGDELHLGGEYVFLGSTPVVAARLGLWLDPDHRQGTRGSELFERAVLQPGDDELHYALGFGLAFQRFQLDLGADFSDLVDTLSISAIYSF